VRTFTYSCVLLGALASAEVALAQSPPPAPPTVVDKVGGPNTKGKTEAVALDDEEDDEEDRPEGWTPGIEIGVGFSVLQSRGVVGMQDGFTIALGGVIDADLEFNEGIHEWRNGLRLEAGVTRSPSLGEFEKSNDALEFETQYLLHALELFGPYVRGAMNTTMFPGVDTEPKAVTYVVTNLDGTRTTSIGTSLALTDPFAPFTFREGIGVFAQPIEEEPIAIEVKAGLGAEQTIAGGIAILDDAATPEVEAKELGDTYMIGAEAVADVWGFFDTEKRVSYSIGADILVPFKTNDLAAGDQRSLIELTSVLLDAGLNVKLFDWASVTYKFGVLREPLLVDKWQVTNSLLLTVGGVFGSKAPEPPKPPCACTKPAAPTINTK